MNNPARSDIFHCPHCGAENAASAGAIVCRACGKTFEPARLETVPQPASADTNSTDAEDRAAERAQSEAAVGPSLPSGVELGGYTLERELGRGGMGIVYLATQKSLGRKVAVKVLPRRLAADPKFRARFEREAFALATLNHANIVQIIDRGMAGETCYLVMEYVEGVSLRRLFLDHKLTPEQALAVVPQICAALEYAHSKGIVHRDIKPENILLTPDEQVKITDFGLARIVHGDGPGSEQRLTHTNVLMGTPEYMAPEQRERAKGVDHRADIFSLGVIFYEMLTGELPLGRFQAPSKKVSVDVRLDEVVLKSLEKEPDLRYQRAQHLSKDVQGIALTYVSGVKEGGGESPGGRATRSPSAAGLKLENAGVSIAIDSGGVSINTPGVSLNTGSSAPSRPTGPAPRCYRLPDGRRIEIAPGKRVRIYEAASPLETQAATLSGSRSEAAGARLKLHPLALSAFILALIPFGLLLLAMPLMFIVRSESASSMGGAVTKTSSFHIEGGLWLALGALAAVMVAMAIFRRLQRRQT